MYLRAFPFVLKKVSRQTVALFAISFLFKKRIKKDAASIPNAVQKRRLDLKINYK